MAAENLRVPDFIIIGAMKSATSTLHLQLSRQPNFHMSTPKEPCFFSDDAVYSNGISWYFDLFSEASKNHLCGESSTHYTKLPSYPDTVQRMRANVPNCKLIYVMRHPIDRLISQYVHHWTENATSRSLEETLKIDQTLISYSKYAMQLRPYLETFGRENILPVFFDRLRVHPQLELERICRFLGSTTAPVWDFDIDSQNVGASRMRDSRWRSALVYAPIISSIRQYLPHRVRDWVKTFWQMRKTPELSDQESAALQEVFDSDLAILGSWLGVNLTCENFRSSTIDQALEWT